MKINEKRLYLENTLSQQLIIIYILGNTAFAIFYVNNMDVDVQLGGFILLNIALALVGFLMAVRQKLYDISWAYPGLAMGIFQFVRMLWIPEEIVNPIRLLLVILLIITGLAALAGSAVCIKRSRERQKFIAENEIDLALLQR